MSFNSFLHFFTVVGLWFSAPLQERGGAASLRGSTREADGAAAPHHVITAFLFSSDAGTWGGVCGVGWGAVL